MHGPNGVLMKSFAAVAVVALGFIATHSHAYNPAEIWGSITSRPDPAIRAEALNVCATGRVSVHFVQPADACWTSFTLSLDAKNYLQALQSVKYGCQQHGRGDHCLFLAHLASQNTGIVQTRAAADQAVLGDALRRAAASMHPLDTLDAEIGVEQRKAARKTHRQRRVHIDPSPVPR